MPQPDGQMLNATVTAQSQAADARPVRQIILKTDAERRDACGSAMSRGSSSARKITARSSRVNGHPGAGIAISLAPGADALKTAELVKARDRASCRRTFPKACTYAYANDTTDFIKLSVERSRRRRCSRRSSSSSSSSSCSCRTGARLLVPAIAIPVVLLGHVRGVLHRRLHDQHA